METNFNDANTAIFPKIEMAKADPSKAIPYRELEKQDAKFVTLDKSTAGALLCLAMTV